MRGALITGGRGFIGRNLTQELISGGCEVFSLDRGTPDIEKRGLVSYISGDLLRPDEINIKEGSLDVLYHLAWVGVGPGERLCADIQKQNIELAVSAVKLAKRLNIPKLVFLGSTMEYTVFEGKISEKTLPSPQNAYGAAKLAARFIASRLAKDLALDFNYAVLTSVYGPGREDESFIHYTLRELLSGKSPSLSEGRQAWDFIHIKDASAALRLIGERGKPESLYTVGTGDSRSVRERAEIIARLVGNGIKPSFKSGEKALPSSVPDVSILTRDTGFSPRISFEGGISELINFSKGRNK